MSKKPPSKSVAGAQQPSVLKMFTKINSSHSSRKDTTGGKPSIGIGTASKTSDVVYLNSDTDDEFEPPAQNRTMTAAASKRYIDDHSPVSPPTHRLLSQKSTANESTIEEIYAKYSSPPAAKQLPVSNGSRAIAPTLVVELSPGNKQDMAARLNSDDRFRNATRNLDALMNDLKCKAPAEVTAKKQPRFQLILPSKKGSDMAAASTTSTNGPAKLPETSKPIVASTSVSASAPKLKTFSLYDEVSMLKSIQSDEKTVRKTGTFELKVPGSSKPPRPVEASESMATRIAENVNAKVASTDRSTSVRNDNAITRSKASTTTSADDHSITGEKKLKKFQFKTSNKSLLENGDTSLTTSNSPETAASIQPNKSSLPSAAPSKTPAPTIDPVRLIVAAKRTARFELLIPSKSAASGNIQPNASKPYPVTTARTETPSESRTKTDAYCTNQTDFSFEDEAEIIVLDSPKPARFKEIQTLNESTNVAKSSSKFVPKVSTSKAAAAEKRPDLKPTLPDPEPTPAFYSVTPTAQASNGSPGQQITNLSYDDFDDMVNGTTRTATTAAVISCGFDGLTEFIQSIAGRPEIKHSISVSNPTPC